MEGPPNIIYCPKALKQRESGLGHQLNYPGNGFQTRHISGEKPGQFVELRLVVDEVAQIDGNRAVFDLRMRCSTPPGADRIPDGWIIHLVKRVKINAHSEVGPSERPGMKTENANELTGVEVPSCATPPVTPAGQQTVQALEKQPDVFTLKCDAGAHANVPA